MTNKNNNLYNSINLNKSLRIDLFNTEKDSLGFKYNLFVVSITTFKVMSGYIFKSDLNNIKETIKRDLSDNIDLLTNVYNDFDEGF